MREKRVTQAVTITKADITEMEETHEIQQNIRSQQTQIFAGGYR